MTRRLMRLVVWAAAAALPGCGGDGQGPTRPAAQSPQPPQPAEARAPQAAGDAGFALPDGFRLVDLTHTFDERTIYWPTEAGFQLERGPAGVTEKGYYYAANRFTAAEHGGTHLDAPIHFFAERHTVEAIPLDRLVGPAVLVDVSAQCAGNADYQIGVADLRGWEEQHQRLLVDVIVLLKTGWSDIWPDRRRYLGTDQVGPPAVAQLHFPGLHPDAARWLVEHRAAKCVGIDTPSIDYGQSQLFQSHVTLFERNVPVLENVALGYDLPAADFLVAALPMKIGGGSGAPLRIVALVPAQAPEKPPAAANDE